MLGVGDRDKGNKVPVWKEVFMEDMLAGAQRLFVSVFLSCCPAKAKENAAGQDKKTQRATVESRATVDMSCVCGRGGCLVIRS